MRENTRLRDLYRLSMEMCFHTEAGTWNNLPDNPWHWGNWKVRLTLGDRSAHRVFLLIPDSLSFWTQKYFPTFLCTSPTGNFTTLIGVTDSQVTQQKIHAPSSRKQRGCWEQLARPLPALPQAQPWDWFIPMRCEWKCEGVPSKP